MRHVHSLAPGSGARARAAAFARRAGAPRAILDAVAGALPVLPPTNASSSSGFRGDLLNALIDDHRPHSRKGAESPEKGFNAAGISLALDALPPAWRELAEASRALASGSGSGRGAAEDAASLDPLDPAFLYRPSRRPISFFDPGDTVGERDLERSRLAVGLYRACLVAFPAATRAWFGDQRDRKAAASLALLTSAAISPALIHAEMDAVERAADGRFGGIGGDFDSSDDGGGGSLTVRTTRRKREISASYAVDESALELRVTLPRAYPLEAAELEMVSRVGVSEARARRWMLSVRAIVSRSDGAGAGAGRSVPVGLARWKRDADKEFSGVEPCPICYCVVHAGNHQTPKMRCAQCQNKYHGACLYKWFTESSKSTCPMCQTPWGASYSR